MSDTMEWLHFTCEGHLYFIQEQVVTDILHKTFFFQPRSKKLLKHLKNSCCDRRIIFTHANNSPIFTARMTPPPRLCFRRTARNQNLYFISLSKSLFRIHL